MHLKLPGLAACCLAAISMSQAASAQNFNRVATLANYINNADAADTTVSEIIAVNADGDLIVYTDAELGQIGFVDITDPSLPMPAGTFDVGGEPTSVAVLGNQYALVGINTSPSLDTPSGHLAVIDISALPATFVTDIDLGGQPDSVAISPSGNYVAVAIENERDEDITIDGVEGGLPQAPPGFLAVIDLGLPNPMAWTSTAVDLTGLAEYAPGDPEPEFVDINAEDEAVVTLQENNHIVIVDLTTLGVTSHFSAGTVDLEDVDATEDRLILLEESLADVAREPDAVAWVMLPEGYAVATANEGDLFGGSRGFTLFDPETGDELFDSGSEIDWHAVRFGHYPDDRSENKGSEPEAIEFAAFGQGQLPYLFVGSERGSFIAVYALEGGSPVFAQLLPGPLGPEGLLAIPGRNLLLASGEEDDPEFGVRSSIMLYELQQDTPAAYPQILSGDSGGKPIGWSALSGMLGVPGSETELLAVWDSFYSQSQIFTIDTTETPALVTSALPIQGGSGDFDPEGIAFASEDSTYWIASEGNAGSRPNRLLQLDSLGVVLDEVRLPASIEVCRSKSASEGSLGAGFEGLAILDDPIPGITSPGRSSTYFVLVAQQRGWNYTTPGCETRDDDPFDIDAEEPGYTRIWVYDVRRHQWDHIAYELEAVPENAAWVGLSEITRVDGGFIVIERDNRTGDFAVLKTLVYFADEAIADGVVTADEKHVYDLLDDLLATNGWITDKPEGVAVTESGELFVVTDNDGVDEWSGETWFLRLGPWESLFNLD